MVELIGLNRLLGKLRPSWLLNPPLKDFQRDATKELERNVESLAPVFKGDLKHSVTAQVRGPEEGEVHVGVRYAGFPEFGTRHMRGQRFVRRAIDQLRLRTKVMGLARAIERRWR